MWSWCVGVQVGRSGRFGHLGLAVNLITYEDRFNLCALLRAPFTVMSNEFEEWKRIPHANSLLLSLLYAI